MALGFDMSMNNDVRKGEHMNTDTDISDEELQTIQDQIDAEIETLGLPSDDELLQEVENMNQQLAAEKSDRA
jgi:hypothetical protein